MTYYEIIDNQNYASVTDWFNLWTERAIRLYNEVNILLSEGTYFPCQFTELHLSRCPTQRVSIEFEILLKFRLLWFKIS